jgi:hypothetical protein
MARDVDNMTFLVARKLENIDFENVRLKIS